MIEKIIKTDDEWRNILTPEQFEVMREHATERPYLCDWLNRKEPGTYNCAACDLPLFNATEKFDSGTGWPSYFEPASPEHISYVEDTSREMEQTEILCARCESHLGHVFDDLPRRVKAGGPPSSGKRYCINSIALNFKHRTDEK